MIVKLNIKLLINLFFWISIQTISAQSVDTIFVKENLGRGINSVNNELSPVISADGKTLYFTRQGDRNNLGYKYNHKDFDIWFSELQEDGSWGEAKNIGAPLNNKGNNYICSISPDGNLILLGGEYVADTTIDKGVSISYRTKNGWSKPKLVKIKNYYNMNDYVSFFLASDNQTLFMSVEKEDTYGDKDLYVAFKETEDEWSEPLNLGPNINTSQNEGTPFFSPDSKSLYFSSNGRGGYGSMDIFLSRKLDSTWTHWSEPVNLGSIYNTEKSEGGLYMSADGAWAYFISYDNAIGGSDIFRITVKEEIKPKKIMLVSFIIETPDGTPLQEARVYYKEINSDEVWGQARTDPRKDIFKLALPIEKEYRVMVISDNYISEPILVDALDHETSPAQLTYRVKLVNLADLNNKKIVPENLDLVSDDILQKVIFDNKTLNFPYNAVPIDGDYFPDLDYVSKIMNKYPQLQVEIVGHTDSVGTWAYNKKLSERRAKEAGDYLKSKNVSSDRIVTRGMSFDVPKESNDTESGRAKNRRVEFYIFRNH